MNLQGTKVTKDPGLPCIAAAGMVVYAARDVKYAGKTEKGLESTNSTAL